MLNTRNVLLVSIAALSLLAGCKGHGAEVSKGASIAKQRLDGLKAATEFQMAEAAFSNEDLDKAHKHVSKSIALNGSVVRSHVLLGKIHLERGNIELAAKSFADAEAVDATAVDPQYYMGLLNERTAKKEAALARYLVAANLAKDDPQYALAAAEVMIDLGQITESKAFLEERRSQFEHSAGIRQTLGHIAMMQGDLQTAIKEFSDARLLSPTDQGMGEDLARAHFELEQYSEAESILSKILQNPDNAIRRDLLLMQANCLMNLERLPEARELLLKLTRDTAGAHDVEAFISLGNVSFLMKDMVRVRQTASRVVAMAPKRPEGYLLRALHMRHAGDFTNAESSARQALKCGGGGDAWMMLGMIQQDSGRTEEAKESFAKADEADRGRAEAMVQENQD
jgi:tetratricopeptide (TPR) repeat protein